MRDFSQHPPSSICLLRLSAIGDVTHVAPIIHTLRHAWPDVSLTWIIGKVEATLMGDFPGVRFVVYDKSAGLGGWFRLRRALRGERFDILLNMQVAARASLASLAVRAKVRLGFDRARARDYQWLFTNAKITAKPRQHVLDGFFGFLAAMGITTRQMRWDIPIPEHSRIFAANQLETGKRLLVINPCTSNRARNWRNWQAARYAAIATHAIEKHGMTVALTGGPDPMEQAYGKEIAALCPHPIIGLIGKTRLKDLLAVLDAADVVISPDTGPAHMAAATGTPVIGLYASSNPYRTGPYSYINYVVNRYPDALRRYLDKDETEVSLCAIPM